MIKKLFKYIKFIGFQERENKLDEGAFRGEGAFRVEVHILIISIYEKKTYYLLDLYIANSF